MTIPIQGVQIHPQFVPNTQPPGVELLLKALDQRHELDLARQKNAREMQQFELQKRLMGTEIAGNELVNEKRKRELKDQADDLLAKDTAHQLFVGNLTRIHDMRGWGEVIANVKDKDVGAHLMEYVKDYFTTSAAQPTQNIVTTPSATSPSGYAYSGIDPRNPAAGGTGTGVAAPNPNAPTQRIPVVTEREKASAAVGAIRANAITNRLESADPTIGQRVAAKVAIRKSLVGGILRRLAGTSQEDANFLAEQQIEKSMAPDELEYYVAAKQWLGSVLPGLSGKQVTGREYMMQAPAYFSMGSGSPGVVANRAAARSTRTKSFASEAGDAMTERLPELQQAGIDLSPYGLGPKPPSRPDPSRYYRP